MPSLQTRLVGLAAISGAALVSLATWLQLSAASRAVEREDVDAAGATALGVAAGLTERGDLPDAQELEDLRQEFLKAVPTIRSLSVLAGEPGALALVASTDTSAPGEAPELAARALARRELSVSDERPGPTRLVAVPLERNGRPYGAVVVETSMEAVARVRRDATLAAALAAPAASIALVAALALLTRRYVRAPLESVLDTMRRGAAGEPGARARVVREDEIGALARGLNALLDRLEGASAVLSEQVRLATQELALRNAQLAQGAQRLFAARSELARAEQLAAAGQMAASVAHQVGTPLNLISGYVQLMLAEARPGSLEAARLRTVLEQIGRVTGIVQGLLDRARQPDLQLRPVAAGELLAGVAELSRPSLERAGVAVATQAAPGLPPLHVDRGQIEQVLLNLVTNALDAMAGGGELRLSAAAEEGGIAIEVADSGPGIRPELLSRVFDPLFTTKPRGAGTGLGLSIVREVVAAHGGRVSVESEPGRGARFRVLLPAAPAEEERPA